MIVRKRKQNVKSEKGRKKKHRNSRSKPLGVTVATGAQRRRSLKSVVGEKTYSVWTEMLHQLVPQGRTHRLAPLVAGMLQYASAIAYEKFGDEPAEGSVAHSLLFALEHGEPDQAQATLSDVVVRLFEDSKVDYRRIAARGDEYNLIDSVIAELFGWESMPWE